MLELVFICIGAVAVDGDTLRCRYRAEAGGRVRLAGIDAPEMPGHCRAPRNCAPGDPIAAKAKLAQLITGEVRCKVVDASPFKRGFQQRDGYGRPVARCRVGGVDLGAAMLAAGLVVRWPR